MSFDVVIVGAGLPSCALAYALSKAKRPPSVLLVDDRSYLGGQDADVRSRETDLPLGTARYLDRVENAHVVDWLSAHVRFSQVGCANVPGWENVVYPQGGWSQAARRFADGVEVVLGTNGVEALPRILTKAKQVYWTGRLDHLPHREWGGWEVLGHRMFSHQGRSKALWLPYRDVQVTRRVMSPLDPPVAPAGNGGRELNHRRIVGGSSSLGTVEIPIPALMVSNNTRWPSDPGAEDPRQQLAMASNLYPNLRLLGKLARYREMSLGGELAEVIAEAEAFIQG
jgi:hypothetical protein